MMLQVSRSKVGNLLVLLWIGLMVTHCPCAPPPEPIVYVTLSRWENKTLSPRLYYVMAGRSPQANHNQVQEPYPYESTVSLNKLDEKEILPFFSVRNSFNKNPQIGLQPSPQTQLEQSPPTTPSTQSSQNQGAQTIVINSENGTGVDDTPDGDQSIKNRFSFPFLSPLNPLHERIMFDEIESKEEEPIVFQESNNTLANRRTTPDGGQNWNKLPSPQEIVAENRTPCYKNSGKVVGVKDPRDLSKVTEDDKIRTFDFTFKLFHGVRTRSRENLIFSPFSIFNILSLLLLGASNSTFSELSKILSSDSGTQIKNEEDTSFHESFRDLLHILKHCSHPKVLLESANEVFAEDTYPLTLSYKNDAMKFYDASVQQFDFKSHGEAFVTSVNAWVREKTRGKIQSVIDIPPSPLTTLALVNAIYFQGSWEIPFAPQITREGLFQLGDNITLPIKLMANVMQIPYLATENYQMVRLPYKGNETALYIILPKVAGVSGLLDVEKNLEADVLQKNMKLMSTAEPTLVTLKIPKMRIESDGHLKDILSNLGVKSIFNSTTSNFSRISPTPGLHISSLLHKAIVDINEKGTEASAVSIATGDRNLDVIPATFVANRPFLFFIYNEFADTVLFWGRVVRPQPLRD